MRDRIRRLASPPLIVSVAALVFALGGGCLRRRAAFDLCRFLLGGLEAAHVAAAGKGERKGERNRIGKARRGRYEMHARRPRDFAPRTAQKRLSQMPPHRAISYAGLNPQPESTL